MSMKFNISINELHEKVQAMRLDILRLAHAAGNKGAHIAPSLSAVEIMAVLFTAVMDHSKDLFVLSKGHGGLCYYCAMYQAGLITHDQLDSFEENGGIFPGQPSRCPENGVCFSSGSLGLGLAYAAGLALQRDRTIYTLLGDGELNEGSNWEAAMFASQQKLTNLVAIIDRNEMQSDGFSKDIMNIAPDKLFLAAGWSVVTCEGHHVESLLQAFQKDNYDMPKVIIAKTVKGKGVSFMENNREWHHSRLTDAQFVAATQEVKTHV
jgi:transketolase